MFEEKQVTREQLQTAVEAGIARAERSRDFATTDRDKLREVAATTRKVACGATDFTGCGCPAVQAGLWTVTSAAPGMSAFAAGFDIAAGALLGGRGFYTLVVTD